MDIWALLALLFRTFLSRKVLPKPAKERCPFVRMAWGSGCCGLESGLSLAVCLLLVSLKPHKKRHPQERDAQTHTHTYTHAPTIEFS